MTLGQVFSSPVAADGSADLIELHVDAGIARIVLNRPSARNSLTLDMAKRLGEVIDAVDANASIRVLVIEGRGRAFCAGADLRSGVIDATAEQTLTDVFNPIVARLRALGIPTLAAVGGVTAGGGVGIALACDLVIAVRSAAFHLAFAPKLALIPDLGTSLTLAAALGRARALGHALTGTPIEAEAAQARGLIWAVVDDGDLDAAVTAQARALADGPTAALVETRRAIDRTYHDLGDQLAYEAGVQARQIASPEFAMAIAKFAGKA
jgi:2-(1,2-epoxy-1,2-dihydrophenyl)acetyl-CoA isomerase